MCMLRIMNNININSFEVVCFHQTKMCVLDLFVALHHCLSCVLCTQIRFIIKQKQVCHFIRFWIQAFCNLRCQTYSLTDMLHGWYVTSIMIQFAFYVLQFPVFLWQKAWEIVFIQLQFLLIPFCSAQGWKKCGHGCCRTFQSESFHTQIFQSKTFQTESFHCEII